MYIVNRIFTKLIINSINGVTMKKIKIINSLFILVFAVMLSSSVFAQEKPCTEKAKACCSDKTANHVCAEECKTAGCDAVKAKEGNTTSVKHVCKDECHDKGCDVVKAKEARAALDVNSDGNIYECSMKCEASDKAGECSKCGMELKKVSVKDS